MRSDKHYRYIDLASADFCSIFIIVIMFPFYLFGFGDKYMSDRRESVIVILNHTKSMLDEFMQYLILDLDKICISLSNRLDHVSFGNLNGYLEWANSISNTKKAFNLDTSCEVSRFVLFLYHFCIGRHAVLVSHVIINEFLPSGSDYSINTS